MTISSHSFKSLLSIFVLGLLLFSCKTREKLVYLQGPDAGPALQTNYQPVLRTDDQLLIQVGGSEMEALAPFQFYYMSNQQGGGGQQGMQMLQNITYIIDINGNINFPQLGFVQLAGLTRLQAVELLQSRLSEYVSNPTVNIQVLNFKYSVLGQVRNPGLYNCPTERFTILEAIAQAGDLQATGLRNNVLVVREQNGQRVEYRLDLTSKDLYQSPAYYIRQNDVIYVEPNFTANFQGTNVQIFTQLGSTALSLILSVFTLISLSK
jgi:polysaccharide export outer membrane protein